MSECRIRYNKKYLDDVVPEARIIDIRVSPIALTPQTRQRAERFGSEFVRMDGGTRTVTIEFAILIEDWKERQDALAAVTEWAKSDAEYDLVLPGYDGKHLTCVCTARPEPSLRQWWESKLRLVFTCYDNPYWTSDEEISASCGNDFTVAGTAPPLMTITRRLTSRAANQTYSNGRESMSFSQIPAGSLTIDLNRQTVAIGTTSIMQYYLPSSTFLKPRTGAQNISGTGTIKYRERWE